MKLLVDSPSGKQELIEVCEGGGYFDNSRVLWDERTDGDLPAIALGGMVRDGSSLVFSQPRLDEHEKAIKSAPKPGSRMDALISILIENKTITQEQAETLKGK